MTWCRPAYNPADPGCQLVDAEQTSAERNGFAGEEKKKQPNGKQTGKELLGETGALV